MFSVYPLKAAPDDAYRVPQLNHKKSRFGCRKCKARRVKCDEARPRCRNCERHRTACVYERSPAQDRSGNPSPSTSSSPAWSESNNSQPSRAELDGVAGSVDGDDPAESRERRLLEARLMHRYIVETGPATAIDEITRPVVAEAVPARSLYCDALLYAMYSVAALHLARGEDDASSSLVVHQRYLSMALREHQASLCSISSHNVDDLCLTSGLLRVCAYATLQGRPLQTYTPPAEWFMISGTVLALYEAAWTFVEENPDSMAYKYLNSAQGKRETFAGCESHSLAHLTAREPEDVASEPWDLETQEAYAGALRYLGSVQAAVEDGVADGDVCRRLTIFPMYIDRRFRELVLEARPRALVVLAHYFALLVPFEHIWWIGFAPTQEVRAIAGALTGRWKRLLELPLRVIE